MYWGCFGVVLDIFGGYFCDVLGMFWGCLGVFLGVFCHMLKNYFYNCCPFSLFVTAFNDYCCYTLY